MPALIGVGYMGDLDIIIIIILAVRAGTGATGLQRSSPVPTLGIPGATR